MALTIPTLSAQDLLRNLARQPSVDSCSTTLSRYLAIAPTPHLDAQLARLSADLANLAKDLQATIEGVRRLQLVVYRRKKAAGTTQERDAWTGVFEVIKEKFAFLKGVQSSEATVRQIGGAFEAISTACGVEEVDELAWGPEQPVYWAKNAVQQMARDVAGLVNARKEKAQAEGEILSEGTLQSWTRSTVEEIAREASATHQTAFRLAPSTHTDSSWAARWDGALKTVRDRLFPPPPSSAPPPPTAGPPLPIPSEPTDPSRIDPSALFHASATPAPLLSARPVLSNEQHQHRLAALAAAAASATPDEQLAEKLGDETGSGADAAASQARRSARNKGKAPVSGGPLDADDDGGDGSNLGGGSDEGDEPPSKKTRKTTRKTTKKTKKQAPKPSAEPAGESGKGGQPPAKKQKWTTADADGAGGEGKTGKADGAQDRTRRRKERALAVEGGGEGESQAKPTAKGKGKAQDRASSDEDETSSEPFGRNSPPPPLRRAPARLFPVDRRTPLPELAGGYADREKTPFPPLPAASTTPSSSLAAAPASPPATPLAPGELEFKTVGQLATYFLFSIGGSAVRQQLAAAGLPSGSVPSGDLERMDDQALFLLASTGTNQPPSAQAQQAMAQSLAARGLLRGEEEEESDGEGGETVRRHDRSDPDETD